MKNMTSYFLTHFGSISHLNRPALISKNKDEISWQQYYEKCILFASSLQRLNIDKKESVAIMGFNAPEWFYSAIGSFFYGCTYIGIYPTNGPEEVDHVLNVSNASVLVIQNNKLLENIKLKKKLKQIILYEDEPMHFENNGSYVITFNNFIKGNTKKIYEIRRDPSDVVTYIMTSGTTGKSKAVKITYENISYTCGEMSKNYLLDHETIVSYLPLSHIAASMLDMFCHFYHKGTIYFAKPDALQGSLVDTLVEANPTIFLGVPRVWEKISEKMQSVAAAKYDGWFGKILKIVMEFVKEKTMNYHNGMMNDQEVSYWTKMVYKIARVLFFNKIKKTLGLGECHYFFSGAAPISKDTLDYFSKIDIIIYEIFGMSETCGIISANKDGFYRKGSVGKPLIGTVRIAEDGEILYKGKNNFIGYKDNEQATNEILNSDGWLHTGDVGTIDKDGFLFISGRKKELIITAGGENVAPIIIENSIKKQGQYISHVIVIGDRRKFLTALITIPISELPKNNVDPDAKTTIEATLSQKWFNYVKNAIDKYNENPISNAQKIQKFKILSEDFTIENDLMTPTMKIKRSKINQKYSNEIEELYK